MAKVLACISFLVAFAGGIAAAQSAPPEDRAAQAQIANTAAVFETRVMKFRQAATGPGSPGWVPPRPTTPPTSIASNRLPDIDPANPRGPQPVTTANPPAIQPAKYPAADLNDALSRTKSELLSALPAQAAPTRAYVEHHFPSRIRDLSPSDLVDMNQCAQYIANAEDILKRLQHLSAYELTLVIDSNRNQATFQLTSSTGKSWSQPTRGNLLIYRGEYSYTVVKDGQKTITGDLDLIQQPGDMLQCTFVPSTSPDAPMPCLLTSSR